MVETGELIKKRLTSTGQSYKCDHASARYFEIEVVQYFLSRSRRVRESNAVELQIPHQRVEGYCLPSV